MVELFLYQLVLIIRLGVSGLKGNIRPKYIQIDRLQQRLLILGKNVEMFFSFIKTI